MCVIKQEKVQACECIHMLHVVYGEEPTYFRGGKSYDGITYVCTYGPGFYRPYYAVKWRS